MDGIFILLIKYDNEYVILDTLCAYIIYHIHSMHFYIFHKSIKIRGLSNSMQIQRVFHVMSFPMVEQPVDYMSNFISQNRINPYLSSIARLKQLVRVDESHADVI